MNPLVLIPRPFRDFVNIPYAWAKGHRIPTPWTLEENSSLTEKQKALQQVILVSLRICFLIKLRGSYFKVISAEDDHLLRYTVFVLSFPSAIMFHGLIFSAIGVACLAHAVAQQSLALAFQGVLLYSLGYGALEIHDLNGYLFKGIADYFFFEPFSECFIP